MGIEINAFRENGYRLLEDLKGQSRYLIWGSIPNNAPAIINIVASIKQVEEVRQNIVETHFAQPPSLLTLGRLEVIENPNHHTSFPVLMFLTLKKFRHEKICNAKDLCKAIAGLVGCIAFVALAIRYTPAFMRGGRRDLRKALERSDYAEVFFNSPPMLIFALLVWLISVPMYILWESGATRLLSKIQSLYREVQKNGSDRFLVVQTLPPMDLSSAQPINNRQDPETHEWEDPISCDLISANQINTPHVLQVGRYLCKIENMLERMFAQPLVNEGQLSHPFESRALSEQDQAKFLKDMCDIFCIDDAEKILNCWNWTVSQVENELGGVENPRMKSNKIFISTMQNFQKLVSEETLKSHFAVMYKLYQDNKDLFPGIQPPIRGNRMAQIEEIIRIVTAGTLDAFRPIPDEMRERMQREMRIGLLVRFAPMSNQAVTAMLMNLRGGGVVAP